MRPADRADVQIGTGAKVLGGDRGRRRGPDRRQRGRASPTSPPGATVVGVPARPSGSLRRIGLLRRNRSHARPTAVAERRRRSFAEIDQLVEQNRSGRDPDTRAADARAAPPRRARLAGDGGRRPGFPEPDFDALADGRALPEVTPADLTPELLRAGILRDGACSCAGCSTATRRWASPRRSSARSRPGPRSATAAAPRRATTRSSSPVRRSTSARARVGRRRRPVGAPTRRS